jgi:hypothetical protein
LLIYKSYFKAFAIPVACGIDLLGVSVKGVTSISESSDTQQAKLPSNVAEGT